MAKVIIGHREIGVQVQCALELPHRIVGMARCDGEIPERKMGPWVVVVQLGRTMRQFGHRLVDFAQRCPAHMV